jgi:hypothetical protein
MKNKLLIVLFFLLAASLACTLGGALPSGETDKNILFKDHFSNTSSGWDSFNQEDGITDYKDGAYRIYVNKTDFDYWANPGLADLPGDVRVEVDVTKTAGPDVNDIGIICRSKDSDTGYNFYYFVISSDGFANIGMYSEGTGTYFIPGWQQTDAIILGNATNHIRATCIGSTLTLYANDTQVAQVSDSTIPSGGDVGLLAGTFDIGGTDILFDNFIVTRP